MDSIVIFGYRGDLGIVTVLCSVHEIVALDVCKKNVNVFGFFFTSVCACDQCHVTSVNLIQCPKNPKPTTYFAKASSMILVLL